MDTVGAVVTFITVSCYFLQALTNKGCLLCCCHHLPLEIHLSTLQLGNKPNWGTCSWQRRQHVKVPKHTLNWINLLQEAASLTCTQSVLFVDLSFLWCWVVDTRVCDCVRLWQQTMMCVMGQWRISYLRSSTPWWLCSLTLLRFYSHPPIPPSPDCTAEYILITWSPLPPTHIISHTYSQNWYWWPIPLSHLPQLEKTLCRIGKDWATYLPNKQAH